VLTEIKAYSSWQSAPTLYLDDAGRAETDLIQIRNVDGLDPVTASVGTTPYGSSDGESYVGSSVLSRNLVLTLHPNPNWINWSPEALRRFLYAYFMPKGIVQLEFYSNDWIRWILEALLKVLRLIHLAKIQNTSPRSFAQIHISLPSSLLL